MRDGTGVIAEATFVDWRWRGRADLPLEVGGMPPRGSRHRRQRRTTN
jgi:hypothetical protein